MMPVIPADSFIMVARWLLFFPLKEGQQILIKHPRYGVIVKTVAVVDNNGFIWSKGENDGSLTVEQIGPVNKQQVLGKVIRIFKPITI